MDEDGEYVPETPERELAAAAAAEQAYQEYLIAEAQAYEEDSAQDYMEVSAPVYEEDLAAGAENQALYEEQLKNYHEEELAKQHEMSVEIANNVETYLEYGDLMFDNQRFFLALDGYTDVLSFLDDTRKYRFHICQAILHEQDRNWREMENDCREAIKLNSSSYEARHLLGVALMEQATIQSRKLVRAYVARTSQNRCRTRVDTTRDTDRIL